MGAIPKIQNVVLRAPGEIEVVTGSDPAAGEGISFTVPDGEIWQLLLFRCHLTTAAGGGTRTVSIDINTPDGTRLFRENFTGIGGDETHELLLAQFGYDPADLDTLFRSAFPISTYLTPGFVIESSTDGLEAGDGFSAPTLLVEKFLANPTN